MTKRPMTVEDLWALPRVGSPRPAPDGHAAVVPVTTYDMAANEGTSRLWWVPLDGGTARPLTGRSSVPGGFLALLGFSRRRLRAGDRQLDHEARSAQR